MKLSLNLPLFLSLLALSACSAVKDMDNMTKTTQDMSAKTGHLSDTADSTLVAVKHTGDTADSTLTSVEHTAGTADSTLAAVKHTGDTADATLAAVQATGVTAVDTDKNVLKSLIQAQHIYMDGRPAGGAQTRSEAIADMEKSKDMRGKIAHAAAYFQGFEYQTWKNNDVDDSAELDILYLRAMQEFTRLLGNYMPSDLTKIQVTKTSESMENLYALSVAAKEIYENAIPGTISMLDLIRQTLKLNDRVNKVVGAEKDLKDWQREILANYPEMIYFLQIRTSFLGAMTLGKLSDIGTLNDENLFEFGWVKLLKDEKRGWTLDLGSLNIERLVTATDWINGANTNAVFLESIHEKVIMDDNVRQLLTKMKMVDSSKVQYATGESPQARADAELSFKSAIEGFLTIKP